MAIYRQLELEGLMFKYDFSTLGLHITEAGNWFGEGRYIDPIDAEEWIMEALELESISVEACTEGLGETAKAVLKEKYISTAPNYISIQAKRDVYSKLSFHMREFPGICAWTVCYWLAFSPSQLHMQLRIAEQLSIWNRYGGIVVSQTQEYSEDCVKILDAHGFRSNPIMSSGNPHTSNSVWMWFKPLARPHYWDNYPGIVYASDYPPTLHELDAAVEKIRKEDVETCIEYEDEHPNIDDYMAEYY